MKISLVFLLIIIFCKSNIYAQDPPDNITMEEFKEKALQKTKDFSEYISIISNKKSHPTDINSAIDQSCDLFLNEEKSVEVSKVGSDDKNYYKIREYLNRLKLLQYQKIEIEWSDIYYVSDLKEGPDGNYFGTISISQRFTGFIDGNIAYTDKTVKHIEVVLKKPSYDVGGVKKEYWEVLLSDIGVQVTTL